MAFAQNGFRKLFAKKSIAGKTVGEKFRIGHRIKNIGTTGEIRDGINTDNNEEVIIKLEKKSCKSPQLHLEYNFYKNYLYKNGLNSVPGFPALHYFGPCGKYNAIVFEKLGANLEQMFAEACHRQFSIVTIANIMIQLIGRIEYVHSCGLVHRDIKGQNFLLGKIGSTNADIIHVIDFGLAKPYLEPNGEHIPMAENKPMIGTPRYQSLNSHRGYELSRRDDMESIGYLIIYYMTGGKLPWMGLKAKSARELNEKIGNYKRHEPIERLCSTRDNEFADYLRHVRTLDFDERPDYEYLRQLFVRLKGRHMSADDEEYDWNRSLKSASLIQANQ